MAPGYPGTRSGKPRRLAQVARGYRGRMTHVSADAAERLAVEARAALAFGSAGDDVQLALDQLQADRANGEPLDTAFQRLRDALHESNRTGGEAEP
jgi:hypothetical protein